MKNKHALDKLDIRILRILSLEGRISWRELADKIGLSMTPTLRRVRALEQSGIILGYSTTIDESKLAGSISIFVSITLNQQISTALASFEANVGRIPQVMSCFLMTGGSDYLLRVVVRDLPEFTRVVDRLTKIEGVFHIQSSFALKPVIQRQTPDFDAVTYPDSSGQL